MRTPHYAEILPFLGIGVKSLEQKQDTAFAARCVALLSALTVTVGNSKIIHGTSCSMIE